MKAFIKDCMTGIDGESYDIGRVLWALSVLTYLGLSIYSVIIGEDWRPMEFGTGLAGLLFGGGASLAVKSHTEPHEDSHD